MKEICPVPKRLLIISGILLFIIVIGSSYKDYLNDKKIKDKLSLSLVNKYIEYGEEIDSLDLVEKSYGEISEYPEEIDTSSIGIMKLTYEVSEEDISKEVSFLVEVKDTKKPVIEFNNFLINIKVGEIYDLKKNIKSVFDEVDGNLVYSNNKLEKGSYVISTNLNNKIPDKYEVSVKAMDTNGNIEIKTFDVKVENKSNVLLKNKVVIINKGTNYNFNNNIKKVVDSLNNTLTTSNKGNGYYKISSSFNKDKVGTYRVNISVLDKYNNKKNFYYDIKVVEPVKEVISTRAMSVDSSDVISLAKRYLGYQYVSGGNKPSTGFDCSGYVQFVFSQFGIRVGRSTRDQRYAGTKVSKSSMRPGDILIWSDRRDNYPTHVAIYIGGNKMIHAANHKYDVEIRDIASWRGKIIDVRRV